MSARLVVAALVLLAGGVAAAGETSQVAPPAGRGAKEAAARAAPRAASWAESGRPRVTPGVLVRAAKRAQKNGHGACGPCRAQDGAAAERGNPASIEIEWHAASAAP